MSYNIGTIGTDYVQKDPKGLLVKAVLAPATIEKIKAAGNVMTGVKSQSNLPGMDTDAVFQAGRNCTFNASGTTALSEKLVTVGVIKVQEALCPADLELTFHQQSLNAGSDYDQAAFESDFMDLKAKKIKRALEVALWQGDTASGNAQLNKFDGLVKIIKAATDEVIVTVAGVTVATGVTEANILEVLKAIYAAIPTEILDAEDLTIAVPMEWIRLYKARLTSMNLFHYVADSSNTEAVLIGTNVNLYGTPGLNSLDEAFAFRWSNVYFATDMIDEDDKAELYFAKEAGELRYSVRFKAGVQWGITSEVVRFNKIP